MTAPKPPFGSMNARRRAEQDRDRERAQRHFHNFMVMVFVLVALIMGIAGGVLAYALPRALTILDHAAYGERS